jgi:hypothetical protein
MFPETRVPGLQARPRRSIATLARAHIESAARAAPDQVTPEHFDPLQDPGRMDT